MEQVEIKLVGTTPMLMHNARLSDPLNEYTRRLKAVTSKKKKTDADHMEMAQLEWEGGLYYSEEDGLHVPSENVQAAIVEGAKLDKNGKNVTRAVTISEDKLRLKVKGMPKTLGAMFENPEYVDRRSVRNQQNRVIRTRPRVPAGWTLEFTINADESVISLGDLVSAVVKAGAFAGIGDYRPKFGRFEAHVKRNGEYVDAADFVDECVGRK